MASAWAHKVHGCLTPWQSMQNVWGGLAYGCVTIPPGHAIEAPKDPDTRPGPPPSATVSLGMGMNCASADNATYLNCSRARSLLWHSGWLSSSNKLAHLQSSKWATMPVRPHKTGMCDGRGAHVAGAGPCLQQSLVLSRGSLRALHSLQCMQQHLSPSRNLALLGSRVWQVTI